MSFYREDLARIHHLGFADLARHAADALLALLRDHEITSGRVVDLGCGSGVLAARLLGAGYDVTGIDASRDMLAIARATAPAATLIQGSLHDVPLPPCRAVAATGECFNYLNAGPGAPDALPALFRRLHAVLAPGGVLLFDMALPGRAGPTGTRRHASVTPDWAVVAESVEAADRLERRITTFTRDATGAYRRLDETHLLRLVPPTRILQHLAEAGFDARPLDAYGDWPLPPGCGAFLALRPA